MKIIIDTNVHLSALGFGGSISKNLSLIYRQDQIQIYTSRLVFEKLQQKLNSIKFVKITKGNITQLEINQYLSTYKQEMHFVEPITKVEICRDPDDNMFLELALEIKADYILTGDKDLLSIGQFHSTMICNISDFMRDFQL